MIYVKAVTAFILASIAADSLTKIFKQEYELDSKKSVLLYWILFLILFISFLAVLAS